MNVGKLPLALTVLMALTIPAGAADPPVTIHSPGFPPTMVDAQGRLLEDWGPVSVKVRGEGLTDGPIKVEATTLDGVIPAAKVTTDRGAVKVTATAFRAVVFPAGVDVLTVRIEASGGKPARTTLEVPLPDGAQVGARTVQLQGRTVLTLPPDRSSGRDLRAWGHCDEATSLPGWARPEGTCDPAFRNIRAGMGGTPIVYRFPVAPKGSARVILGLCESHWTEPGQRPLTCQVEGAPPQEVDPIAKWGRHKPGALSFLGKDVNVDGQLDIVVRAGPGGSDRNPILNVIWVFPPQESPAVEKVVTGDLNSAATHHVDVGGPGDQSIYPPGKVEYELALAAGASRELTFLVACKGGVSPVPDTSTWTAASLHRATLQVWRDWKPASPTPP